MRVGVVGATGYVGSELVRWLSAHPDVTEVLPCSRSHAGQALSARVPSLLGFADQPLIEPTPSTLNTLDAVFLAVPHGAASALAASLRPPLLLDCTADHRHHPGWVYGQPEWSTDTFEGATQIAVPGCFATALTLGIAPLARHLHGPIQICAATGSTGSGVTPSQATHHPARFSNLKAYKVLQHQHIPEVNGLLAMHGISPTLLFAPLSAPVDRGIFATIFLHTPNTNAAAVVAQAYANHPLIRIRHGSPELRHVRGTALTDIAVHQHGDHTVVIVALDNLGKGAATQAIQCFNLARGHAAHRGLRTPSLTP